MPNGKLSHAPHFGPVVDEHDHRDRFDADELAIVLSHYDIGLIERIREYPRGSRRSPKVRIAAEAGEFLLKRRATGQDDPLRVRFAQELQSFLGDRGFPVARMQPRRDEGGAMLQLNGRIYELFEFVEGERYDNTPAAAATAGAMLGQLHRLLGDFQPERGALPRGSFHASADLAAMLDHIPRSVTAARPQADFLAMEKDCRVLLHAYREAADRVEGLGYPDWPSMVVHGDWHPGNLLYRDGEIVAVLDFDSVRLEARLADVANGALQFSLRMGSREDPSTWPDGVSGTRIRALVHGYDSRTSIPITPREREALPWLMIEALILESVIPIAATGRFGQLDGDAFLGMIARKVRWLRPRVHKVTKVLEEGAA